MGSWLKGIQLVTLYNQTPSSHEKQHNLHSDLEEIRAVLLGSQLLRKMNVLMYFLSYYPDRNSIYPS